MSRELPLWRSLLYVPVNVEKYVDKAHTRGADCIQLDLEDSVPAGEKERSRALVPAAAKKVRRGGADVVVRINSPFDFAFRFSYSEAFIPIDSRTSRLCSPSRGAGVRMEPGVPSSRGTT